MSAMLPAMFSWQLPPWKLVSVLKRPTFPWIRYWPGQRQRGDLHSGRAAVQGEGVGLVAGAEDVAGPGWTCRALRADGVSYRLCK
jgi:hypothetical protein